MNAQQTTGTDIKIKKAGGKERKKKVSLEILPGLPKLPYIVSETDGNVMLILQAMSRAVLVLSGPRKGP